MSAYGLRVDEQGNATFTGFCLNGFNIGGAATNVTGVFVIRVDRFGNLVWATHDGNDSTQGHTVTCDSSGNTYVLGTLSQESTSPKILCGMSLTGRVFLAKYDNHGQGLWAVSLASKGFGSSVDPVEITSDLDGNTYWTAQTSGTVIFAQTNVVTSPYGGLLVKTDPFGTVQWVRACRADSPGSSPFGKPAADRHGNVYVPGSIRGALSLGVTNLTSSGPSDIFLAKYNTDGELVWLRQAGGPGRDDTYHSAMDPDGNCLISCGYEQSITFGNVTLTNESPGPYTAIAKYDPSGNVLWATQIYQDWNITDVSTDAQGNCYVVAHLQTSKLLLFQKRDSSGNLIWSRTGPEGSLGSWAVDPLGHAYLLISFTLDDVQRRATLSFDDVSVTSLGHYNDFFLLKLDTTTAPRLTAQRTAGDLDLSWPVVADEYHLESNSSLVDSSAWTSNGVLPRIAGASKTVTVGAAAPAQFFRLKKD
jgi:hypothetical protein